MIFIINQQTGKMEIASACHSLAVIASMWKYFPVRDVCFKTKDVFLYVDRSLCPGISRQVMEKMITIN
jgi:hypothetical protein